MGWRDGWERKGVLTFDGSIIADGSWVGMLVSLSGRL